MAHHGEPAPCLTDQLSDRLVDQALLAIGVVTDHEEHPDISNEVGELAKVRADPSHPVDRLAAASLAGVGSKVNQLAVDSSSEGSETSTQLCACFCRTFKTFASSFNRPFEAVDQTRQDVHRTQQQGQAAGVVFAVPFLAIGQKVENRIDLPVHHVLRGCN